MKLPVGELLSKKREEVSFVTNIKIIFTEMSLIVDVIQQPREQHNIFVLQQRSRLDGGPTPAPDTQ